MINLESVVSLLNKNNKPAEATAVRLQSAAFDHAENAGMLGASPRTEAAVNAAAMREMARLAESINHPRAAELRAKAEAYSEVDRGVSPAKMLRNIPLLGSIFCEGRPSTEEMAQHAIAKSAGGIGRLAEMAAMQMPEVRKAQADEALRAEVAAEIEAEKRAAKKAALKAEMMDAAAKVAP